MAVHLQAHPPLCWQMHVPAGVPVLARQVQTKALLPVLCTRIQRICSTMTRHKAYPWRCHHLLKKSSKLSVPGLQLAACALEEDAPSKPPYPDRSAS